MEYPPGLNLSRTKYVAGAVIYDCSILILACSSYTHKQDIESPIQKHPDSALLYIEAPILTKAHSALSNNSQVRDAAATSSQRGCEPVSTAGGLLLAEGTSSGPPEIAPPQLPLRPRELRWFQIAKPSGHPSRSRSRA